MEPTTDTATELSERALLAELRDRRALISVAAVEELELVYAWALAHPAWGVDAVLSRDEFPGGEGTPGVAAFTAEPLAGVLRVSPYAAQSLVADTLDLRHRLPRTWDQVQALEVPVWKARRIARSTRDLPVEAVRWVDRQLIGAAASIGAAALDRLVALAMTRVDPEGQAKREAAERGRWDVTLEHPPGWAGTSSLTATGDTVALGEVLARVKAEADSLAAAGDADVVGVRRVKALVSLVGRGPDQLALGFEAETEASAKPGGGSSGGTTGGVVPVMRLYVHTSLAELATVATGTGNGAGAGHVAAAEVERLGPITTALLKQWLAQAWGACRVTVTPVLDLDDAAWTPRHDPPPRMREQVVLRHRGCVFPFCGRDARSGDLDHVEPWDPDDPGGPGGTRPDNLAPLCRRHHRAKTDGRWRYAVLPDPCADGVRPSRPPEHLWTGPHGQTFLVTGGRTVELGDP